MTRNSTSPVTIFIKNKSTLAQATNRGAVAQCIRPPLKAALQNDDHPQKRPLQTAQPPRVQRSTTHLYSVCMEQSTATNVPSTAQSLCDNSSSPTAHCHSHSLDTRLFSLSLSKLNPSFPLDYIIPSHRFPPSTKQKQRLPLFISLYRSFFFNLLSSQNLHIFSSCPTKNTTRVVATLNSPRR